VQDAGRSLAGRLADRGDQLRRAGWCRSASSMAQESKAAPELIPALFAFLSAAARRVKARRLAALTVSL